MANLKRLRDTENKKIVRAIPEDDPHKKLQVWTNDDWSKLYVYRNSQYLELDTSNSTVAEYGHYWKQLDDEMVWYYLTPEPTNLYNWDEGDEVSYTFKNWTTTLQTWKVKEGETPEYTWDTPTKPATAQYTYTFDDWNPEVWPIYKRTTYEATFTSTVNQYTITFVDEDGTTELDEQTLDYWATPVYAGETPTKEATAQYTYTFSGWTPTIAEVTADATYTATYEATVNQYTAIIESDDTDKGTVDVSEVTADYGTSISAEANVLTIGDTTITATAETGYVFSSWGTLPETLTEDVTITATFEAEATTATISVSVMEGQEEYWSVSASSAEAEIWTQITTNNNTVTIWETTITATAETWYEFDEWLIFAGWDDYVTWDDNFVVAKFRQA